MSLRSTYPQYTVHTPKSVPQPSAVGVTAVPLIRSTSGYSVYSHTLRYELDQKARSGWGNTVMVRC